MAAPMPRLAPVTSAALLCVRPDESGALPDDCACAATRAVAGTTLAAASTARRETLSLRIGSIVSVMAHLHALMGCTCAGYATQPQQTGWIRFQVCAILLL